MTPWTDSGIPNKMQINIYREANMISPHLIASTGDSRRTRNMSFEASEERILLFVYLDKRKFQLNGSRFEFGATGPGLMLWFSFRCYSQSVGRNGIFSSMPLSLRVVSLLTESHKLNRDRRSIISWQTSASQMGHTLVYVDIISRFSWLLFICRVSAEYFGRCESLSVATIIWSNFASDSPMTQWFLFTLSLNKFEFAGNDESGHSTSPWFSCAKSPGQFQGTTNCEWRIEFMKFHISSPVALHRSGPHMYSSSSGVAVVVRQAQSIYDNRKQQCDRRRSEYAVAISVHAV